MLDLGPCFPYASTSKVNDSILGWNPANCIVVAIRPAPLTSPWYISSVGLMSIVSISLIRVSPILVAIEQRWGEATVRARRKRVSRCITQSGGTPSPARAYAPSCGSGYCTGQSKMLLLSWAGGILGRVMMIMATDINIRHLIQDWELDKSNLKDLLF
ncbi:hypothetical protein L6164_012060 [Bauhinia variegata]|uniref:Uncharacterized protein n=1 Tax=Bauhinia variegata TaxID=167791 RepID=A0ACB9P7Z8_BAUVA|nr:hypothetical protein L6164_012060 [Bauhinia variegata]